MTSQDIDSGIQKFDLLGRDVKSRKIRRKIINKRPVPEVFRDRKSPCELSVNRLTPKPNQEPPADHPYLASDRVIEKISARNASAIGQNFYGWIVLSVEDAKKNGRTVCATPSDENKSHADIILPKDAEKDERIRERHIAELVANATWRSRPARNGPST